MGCDAEGVKLQGSRILRRGVDSVGTGHSSSDRILCRVEFSIEFGGCHGNLSWHLCFQKSGKETKNICQISCWVSPVLLAF